MFIEIEAGFMVRYTIENSAYEGSKITYSTVPAPRLTSTTLNTEVITWDKLVTKTKHTTSIDTIPGTTSTTQVDTTQTYKCEIYTLTQTTVVNKDEYITFYIYRKSATYTPPNYVSSDGYKNKAITDSYTIIASDGIAGGAASVSVTNGYKNISTYSHSESNSWNTTVRVAIYIPPVMGTKTIPAGIGVPPITLPVIISSGYYSYEVHNTSYSTSSSTSIREGQALHILGTSSVSMPMVSTNSNTATIVYTTEDGVPTIVITGESRTLNSAYLTVANYGKVESSLFYLGTINASVTTNITSEREV